MLVKISAHAKAEGEQVIEQGFDGGDMSGLLAHEQYAQRADDAQAETARFACGGAFINQN